MSQPIGYGRRQQTAPKLSTIKTLPKPAGPTKISDWYSVGGQLHISKATGTEIVASLHLPTGEVVAMKAADRSRLSRNYAQSIALYSKLHHAHICQLLEV